MREPTQGGGGIVRPVAAVLAVQHVREADHEGNLDPLLHVLEACIHASSRKGHPHEDAQPPSKSSEILHRQTPPSLKEKKACEHCCLTVVAT